MSSHTQDAYSLPQAAARLGIGTTLLRTLIKRNDINVVYIATKPVIRATEIDAYLDAAPTEPPTK